jgi:hypothetical protein
MVWPLVLWSFAANSEGEKWYWKISDILKYSTDNPSIKSKVTCYGRLIPDAPIQSPPSIHSNESYSNHKNLDKFCSVFGGYLTEHKCACEFFSSDNTRRVSQEKYKTKKIVYFYIV